MMRNKNKVLYIIHHRVQKKHPEWSHKRVWVATRWCYEKHRTK